MSAKRDAHWNQQCRINKFWFTHSEPMPTSEGHHAIVALRIRRPRTVFSRERRIRQPMENPVTSR